MSWDYFRLCSQARTAEREGNWEEAKRIWKRLGSQDDIKGINFIQESIRKADEFRAEVKRIKEEQLSEDEILRLASKRVYG